VARQRRPKPNPAEWMQLSDEELAQRAREEGQLGSRVDPMARTLDWKGINGRGLLGGVVAALALGPYALLCFHISARHTTVGYILLLAGAVIAGFLIGSRWALLAAVPFVIVGLASLNDPGPLENTDTGVGGLILVFVALPVALAAGFGALVRTRIRR
jgi:hypothetical protein